VGVSLISLVCLLATLTISVVLSAAKERDTEEALDREKEAREQLDRAYKHEQRLSYERDINLAEAQYRGGNRAARRLLPDRP
jgi:hypothetical protein